MVRYWFFLKKSNVLIQTIVNGKKGKNAHIDKARAWPPLPHLITHYQINNAFMEASKSMTNKWFCTYIARKTNTNPFEILRSNSN